MTWVRRLVWCLGFAALLSLGGRAEAAEPKIGYVDFQRALNEVEEGRSAKSALKRLYEQRQKELAGLQSALEREGREIEQQRHVLSGEALAQKEGAYRQKYMELNQKLAAYKGDLDEQESSQTGRILKSLKQITQRIGREQGYTMILETSQDVVIYSPADADLTTQVIREYNKLPAAQRKAQ